MATPQAPGTTVGETASAGDYVWTWNGSGWDLAAQVGQGYWYGSIQYSWVNVAIVSPPVYLDYV